MARFKTWQLFAVCVLSWGTTWHAITYQLGHTTPEVGVALRFLLACALVLGTGPVAVALAAGNVLAFMLLARIVDGRR